MAVQPVDDPVEELAHVVGEILGWKNILRGRVEQLEQLDYSDYVGIERLRALVDAYGAALDRAERALARMTSLGIAERRQQLEEDKAAAVVVAMNAALAAVELTPGQREAAQAAFMASLRDQVVEPARPMLEPLSPREPVSIP